MTAAFGAAKATGGCNTDAGLAALAAGVTEIFTGSHATAGFVATGADIVARAIEEE